MPAKQYYFYFLLLFVYVCLFFSSITAQETSTARITFAPSQFVSSVQMTGTAVWHYGSDEQTGSVLLKAYANGESSVELSLTRGKRIETMDAFTKPDRTCTWSGFDGSVHETARHNCYLSTVWFLPQITIQPGGDSSQTVISSDFSADGNSIRLHCEHRFAGERNPRTSALLARLSAVDLEINANTGLPRSLLFNSHPDNDAGTDVPTEIQFSDYRQHDGVMTPYHIQKFINHSLVLDLRISEASVSLASSTVPSPAPVVQ